MVEYVFCIWLTFWVISRLLQSSDQTQSFISYPAQYFELLLLLPFLFRSSLRDHWVARLGALRRGTALASPYEQLRTVERIVIHPGYVDTGYINDISLLQLETPVIFSDYVRPVCLPALHQLPLDGTLCTIIGWGQLFEVGRIFRKLNILNFPQGFV